MLHFIDDLGAKGTERDSQRAWQVSSRFWDELSLLLDEVGNTALSAVGAVSVLGHEDAGAAVGVGALITETGNLVTIANLVELQDGQLDGLVLVGNVLGGSVHLLLSLLGTTTQTEDQVQGRLLLDVVVRERAAILELLASEDQTLLIRGNS